MKAAFSTILLFIAVAVMGVFAIAILALGSSAQGGRRPSARRGRSGGSAMINAPGDAPAGRPSARQRAALIEADPTAPTPGHAGAIAAVSDRAAELRRERAEIERRHLAVRADKEERIRRDQMARDDEERRQREEQELIRRRADEEAAERERRDAEERLQREIASQNMEEAPRGWY